MVAKAEQIEGQENPRYLVTSLGKEAWPAQKLYEQLYCARGEMENRIKEQLSLFADRLRTETLRANQLRLYFSSLATERSRETKRVNMAPAAYTPQPYKSNCFNENGLVGRDNAGKPCGCDQ